jgi:hypothetical protein
LLASPLKNTNISQQVRMRERDKDVTYGRFHQ